MSLDQALSVPASQQSFLAFDFGMKRTGVAVGNRMLRQATPQATVVAEGDARFAEIEKRIKEKRKQMEEAAKALDFIVAAKLRDEIKVLKETL